MLLSSCSAIILERWGNVDICSFVAFAIFYNREYFGKELNDQIDPDVTVAWGAASVLD